MKKLPLGYFAVQSDFENAPKDSFTYRGETFEVKEGENLFSNAKEAVEAAYNGVAPTEVICGLPYDSFPAPVLLFSAGKHNIEAFDRVKILKSVVMLGEKAGVNPNLPSSNRTALPELNPERGEGESILVGHYWYGKIWVEAAECECLIMDGFLSAGVRFKDVRKTGGKFRFESKNIIHEGRCGWDHNQYNFVPAAPDSTLDRDVLIKNVRIIKFPDLDYGGSFALINAHKAVLDNVCFEGSGQLIGFTNLTSSYSNCSQFPTTEITVKNSYIANASGENGISFSTIGEGDKSFSATVSGCTIINASRKDAPVINPYFTSDKHTLTVSDCLITDTRENLSAAVSVTGCASGVKVENCSISGFLADCATVAPPPVDVPEYIDTTADITNGEDAHKILKNADFSALDSYYEGTKAYYGDQHVHTKCGGTSDGSFPMSDWPEEMDNIGLDFAIIVDHRQMRGFFLPEWNEERFLMGNEPSARITELNANAEGYSNIHYNMLVPNKYGLAMIFANFPEFEFRGDELNGSHKYPSFTKERFMELTSFIQSIGGMMVHPHPKTMLSSTDPLDFYYGEHMFLETLYETFESNFSFKNYELWTQLLALGKHVYTSGGSDTHRRPSNAVVSTFYTKERRDSAFFEQMKKGDFTVGCVGMKMFIDGNPMGSELEYKDGMVLTLRVDDFFKYQWKENTAYELRIYSDKGLVYKSLYDGTKPQEIALEVKKRNFYRAEVFDLTHGYRVAVSNPIWLDK
ncbi:MAG: right-handed parallel beta-helix repeat-containing protein [Clostridia bacterium]|nr:right-handed parallel beta-helix repeat-containing protein [Clostridia bacterium]